MENLTDILDSIRTNDCPDRSQARDDLRYSISMKSDAAVRNFLSIWLLTPETCLANISASDAQYRAFLVEFWERYNGQN